MRCAGDVAAEDAVEVALVAETDLQGDLGDGEVGSEECFGAVDAEIEEPGMGREAGGVAKGADEIGSAQSGLPGDLFYRDVPVIMCLHESFGHIDRTMGLGRYLPGCRCRGVAVAAKKCQGEGFEPLLFFEVESFGVEQCLHRFPVEPDEGCIIDQGLRDRYIPGHLTEERPLKLPRPLPVEIEHTVAAGFTLDRVAGVGHFGIDDDEGTRQQQRCL